MVVYLAIDVDLFIGNQAIGSGVREVQGYSVDRDWDTIFAVTLRIHRWLVMCRSYVPWMQIYISFGLIKQLGVGWWWVLGGF